MSQEEKVLKYIAKHGSITTLDAFMDLGIARLASRVHGLRQKGHDIESEMIPVTNRFGEKVYVSEYKFGMGEGNDKESIDGNGHRGNADRDARQSGRVT